MLFAAVLLFAPLHPPLASQVETDEPLTVRWEVRPEVVYAGQTFELAAVVRLEDEAFRDNLLQLFPQPLDVPVQVTAFERIEQLTLAPASPVGDPRSVAVDGQVVEASARRLVVGDPSFEVEVVRLARAPRAGTLTLPPPLVHYASATEFRDDFVRGRVPLDRTERDVVGEAPTLEVRALPDRGRPPEFRGAVGAFRLEAAAEPRGLRVGDSLRLTVTVHGGSPLDEGLRPSLDSLAGFERRGVTELEGDGRRRFVFDLTPTRTDPLETPVAVLTSFDPTADPPGFVRLESDRIPIAVRAGPPPSGAGNDAQASTQVAVDAPPDGPTNAPNDETSWSEFPWTVGVVALVLALAVASVVRRRRRPQPR